MEQRQTRKCGTTMSWTGSVRPSWPTPGWNGDSVCIRRVPWFGMCPFRANGETNWVRKTTGFTIRCWFRPTRSIRAGNTRMCTGTRICTGWSMDTPGSGMTRWYWAGGMTLPIPITVCLPREYRRAVSSLYLLDRLCRVAVLGDVGRSWVSTKYIGIKPISQWVFLVFLEKDLALLSYQCEDKMTGRQMVLHLYDTDPEVETCPFEVDNPALFTQRETSRVNLDK